MFLECFPPLEARWRPVTESRLRADLCDGPGRAAAARSTSPSAGPRACGPARSSSTSRPAASRPATARTCASTPCIETLRLGVPPRLLASYYLDGGRLQEEVVTEAVLRSALERVVEGAEAIVELRHQGRAPVLRPGAAVPLVPAADHLRRGQPLARAPDEEAAAPRTAGSRAAGRPVPSTPMAPPKPTKTAHPARRREGRGPRPTAAPRWRWCRCPRPTSRRAARRPPALRRRRVGPLRAHAGDRPPDLRAALRHAGTASSGRASSTSPPRRRAARVQPRRRHPVRRPGDHARHRDRARPARLRPGRRDLQAAARWSARCGRGSAACSPTRTTPTASSASSSSSPSCSPRAPRARARPTASATSCAASAAAASCRSRCGPACRSSRSRWSAPRRPCRSSGRARSWPSCSASRTCPITANMLAFGPLGPLGAALPLPAKIKIRVLDAGALRRRARPAAVLAQPDHGRVRAHPAADPGGALRHAPRSAARSGSGERRWASASSSPGSATFWGGRVAQALEADPTVDVIVGLDRYEPTVQLERTEYVRSDESYSILARIVKAARIDTIVHTFLAVDSTQMASRTIHEINVIGTMNLFAAASAPGSTVRNVVVKSSTLVYGASPEGPGVVLRGDPPRRAAQEHGGAQPPRGRGLRPRLRRRQPARHRGDAAVLQRARPRHHHAAGQGPRAAVRAVRCSATTRASSSSTRPTWCGRSSSCSTTRCRASTTSPATACSRGARWPPSAASAPSRCRRSASASSPAPLRRFGVELPPELLDLLRHGRGVDNRRLKRAGFDYRFTSAGTVADFVEALRIRKTVGERSPATSTSATSSSSSATPPPSSATTPSPGERWAW